MEKVRLGKTEMMVSHVGFGGIPIQRDSEEESIAVVRRCIELGVNFIDTANAYTTSEGRIGKAISGRREGLILATKSHERTSEGIENHLQQSLKQLGVESIDLYQFHNVSDSNALNALLDPKGPFATAEKAKRPIAAILEYLALVVDQILEAFPPGKLPPVEKVSLRTADELEPFLKEPFSEGWKSVYELPYHGPFQKL